MTITLVLDLMENKQPESLTIGEFKLGILNNLTMLCSNFALAYIDYPTQALVKSSKILPVMTMGWFRGTYNYKIYKYICAITITLGLVIFNVAKLGNQVGSMNLNPIGFGLLFLSLFFDGLVATQSDIEKHKRKKPSPFHMMVASNMVGILLNVGIIAYTFIVHGENVFLQVHQNNFYPLVLIGVCATMGQIFVYIIISRFDCFILTTINTSRKFFSVLFSIVYFGHHVGTLHMIGIVLVIISVVADAGFSEYYRRQKKNEPKKEKTE